ncbi:MAG TPA: hypothetical protein DEQ06_08005 [Porphyromonadaceae bacterium]|nr:hypothetical protein [Porphyromonadaceae bacterium]
MLLHHFHRESCSQSRSLPLQFRYECSEKKVGINKNISVHSLRHSFVTHRLESDTDLRYIQERPGHVSSKTTEKYTHITTKGFDQIKNPLDNLDI